MCLDSFSQQPIYVVVNVAPTYNLYAVNVHNCTKTLIGPTWKYLFDLAQTPDGRLWSISENKIYQISTSNGSLTYIDTTYVWGNNLVALDDSLLLTESNSKLYSININNGHTKLIGDIGIWADGDITWYNDELYMTTPVVRIDLNANHTAVINVTPVSSGVPMCWASTTDLFNINQNYIVGFNETDVYQICPIDGSYQMLCPSLILHPLDAASVRLPAQNPPPLSCNLILPVELISFTVDETDKGISCRWKTASENNNSYFDVEKSFDDLKYIKIGTVNGFGAGVTSEQHNYEFIDETLCESHTYYRLKQVDIDGKFVYTKSQVLDCNENIKINFSPNPVYTNFNYSFNSPVNDDLLLSIIDLYGVEVYNETVFITKGTNQKSCNVSYLNDGIYILHITQKKSGKLFLWKFLKTSGR
jgi:hypothetical protein